MKKKRLLSLLMTGLMALILLSGCGARMNYMSKDEMNYLERK